MSVVVAMPTPERRQWVADKLEELFLRATEPWRLLTTIHKVVDDRCGGVVVHIATVVEGSREAEEIMVVVLLGMMKEME